MGCLFTHNQLNSLHLEPDTYIVLTLLQKSYIYIQLSCGYTLPTLQALCTLQSVSFGWNL